MIHIREMGIYNDGHVVLARRGASIQLCLIEHCCLTVYQECSVVIINLFAT